MTALLDAVAAGVTIHDLGQRFEAGMPCSPNHPGFRLALLRRHGDMVRPDGGSASNELIVTGGHVGTHVDALSHVSHDGLLHGGHDAHEAQSGGRFSVHGTETIPPMVRRGVLLDVAGAHGVDILPGGYGVTADDLEKCAVHSGVRPAAGDVALVRTGWARNWSDPETYMGHATGVPGVDPSGAQWLTDHGVALTGADTTAFEQIPAGAGHRVLPVHRLLLVDAGVFIIEHMRLEPLAEAGVSEFVFVLAPLPIVGGTGSPVRPLAVV
ncbi:cyclase family protein [Dactylosporangium salmoneum]|uniref:Cyclase family protein n=1 Tax=Dactylosporangium salmoneum TaxID=53361 RepID=A0ABN3GCV8_9ACTN